VWIAFSFHGFAADPKLTARRIQPTSSAICFYYNRPTNMAYHDLTTHVSPPEARLLLGLNTKFIPTPRYSQVASICTATWIRRVSTVMPLLPRTALLTRITTKMYESTGWMPSSTHLFPRGSPPIWLQLSPLQGLCHRRSPSNLLRHQERVLQLLRNDDRFIVANCDKNLAPASKSS
jgi:hypothetical protein